MGKDNGIYFLCFILHVMYALIFRNCLLHTLNFLTLFFQSKINISSFFLTNFCHRNSLPLGIFGYWNHKCSFPVIPMSFLSKHMSAFQMLGTMSGVEDREGNKGDSMPSRVLELVGHEFPRALLKCEQGPVSTCRVRRTLLCWRP